MELGLNWGVIGAVYLSLLLIGIGYNLLVSWLERKHYSDGYTSFLVVIGVGFTLAGVMVIDIKVAFVTIGAFVFSGSPMILGSIWRYIKTRERSLQVNIHDNETTNLAQ